MKSWKEEVLRESTLKEAEEYSGIVLSLMYVERWVEKWMKTFKNPSSIVKKDLVPDFEKDLKEITKICQDW